jgi:hypothetical protein
MNEYGWHFVGDTLRDGSPVPEDGVWLEHEGPIEICVSGLHFSPHPFDALQYAPGPVLCRVEVESVVAREDDKAVCRRRKIIERHDMKDDLRRFARECALDVIHLWDAPAVVRTYLETGDESMRAAARDAAWAAWHAAWDAARAARDAAGAAAWAAWHAAWVAARDAAGAAARDAAWAAAWDAQRERFAALVSARFGGK